jgi:hypothetical protein
VLLCLSSVAGLGMASFKRLKMARRFSAFITSFN